MIKITVNKKYRLHTYEVRVDGKIRQVFMNQKQADTYAASLSCYLEGQKNEETKEQPEEETKEEKKEKAKKTKIISKFSNGFIREYKGNRDVKASWAIINKETNETILSGFSMRKDLAYSSARNRRRECNELIHSVTGCERLGYPYYQHDLRDRLFPSMREERRLKKENKQRLEIIDKMIRIEIIEIR
jgi:hypothetical protein